MHVKMVRTFHVTEYAEHEDVPEWNYAYKHQRRGELEFDRELALADKVVPNLTCLRCGCLNVYGTSSCVSCDACTTIGCDLVDSSWLPPCMYVDVEGVPDEHLDMLRRKAGPNSWQADQFGWRAYAYSYNNVDSVNRDDLWYPNDASHADDTVGGRLSAWTRVLARSHESWRWPKNYNEQRYHRVAIRKFIYLSHISSVLGKAQDNGYLINFSGDVQTILRAVVENKPWDLQWPSVPL